MNKIGNLICMTLLATTLSGCGLYTKYERETVISNDLYGNVPAGAMNKSIVNEAELLGNLEWREVFVDPTLQSFIESGLESNRDLQKAFIAVEQAEATLRTKRLAFLPQLSSASVGYSTSFASPYPSGGVDQLTASVTPTWVLDVFGSLRNDKMRQKMLTEQAENTVQAVQAQLIASIANLYYTLQMLDAQIEVTEATEVSWSESLRVSKAMMEAGLMNQAGVAQIEAGLYGVQSALRDLLISRDEMQNSLCSLLAISPQKITVTKAVAFEAPAQLQIGVPATTLSQRPDVKVAESALAAAFYNENLAHSNLYPKFTFSYNGSMQLFDYVNPAKWVSTVAGTMTQPIFNSGINRAALEIAKLNYDSLLLDFEQALLNAGIEVNNALKSMGEYDAQGEILSKQVASLTGAARSTQLLMENGTVTYLDVLTSNQTLYSGQLAQIVNESNQYVSLVSLYTALGGGR